MLLSYITQFRIIFLSLKQRVYNILYSSHFSSILDLRFSFTQVHTLDGIKLKDFSTLTAQEHISKAVHDELKKTITKNVAASPQCVTNT